jgi:hypothetical protein
MEIETLKDGLHSFNAGPSQAYPSGADDLTLLIGKLKQSHSWARGELNNMILLNSPEKQIVLTALHEKTEVESFQESDSISFQIIEGELRFNTRQESLLLKEGQLLTLSEKVKYSFTTDAETVLLLTILNYTAKSIES